MAEQLGSKPAFPGVPGDIPSRQSAPINFVVKEGVIEVGENTPNPVDEVVVEAYSTLKRELSTIQDSLQGSNADRRLVLAINNLRNTMTDDFEHLNIIKFGLEGRLLNSLYQGYKVELSTYDAAILREIVTLNSMIALRTDKWKIFSLEAEALDISENDAKLLKGHTITIANLLAEFADHVSSQVPAVLTDASDLINPKAEDREKPTLYALRSVENLVIALVANIKSQQLQTAVNKSAYHWIAEAALSLIRTPIIQLAEQFTIVLGWIPRVMNKLFTK